MIKNTKGSVFYGMHFYPGVAEYQEESGEPYRILLSEKTIRKMNPSFSGRPVFVEHVDDVNGTIDSVKENADGWVVESFYNPSDGKTWVKFIIVSQKGLDAIEKGFRLSNCYIPSSFGAGGVWNGVSYKKEVTDGEFEHLAIVDNPRYDESVILTPDQFKEYCDDNEVELKKLANSILEEKKEKTKMKINFFKKQKVENSSDLENMSVKLPKSGRELTIVKLINEADEKEMKNEAEMKDVVKIGENEMTVEELVNKYNEMEEELKALKKEENSDDIENEEEEEEEEKEEKENDMVEDDEEARELALELAEHEEEEILEEKENKKKNSKKNFNKLKNAHKVVLEDIPVFLSEDRVERGKAKYGSN